MKKTVKILVVGSVASLALLSGAAAQIYVPPGQEFAATPMSRGGFTLGSAAIIPARPPAAALPPPPEPAPVKHRRGKRAKRM